MAHEIAWAPKDLGDLSNLTAWTRLRAKGRCESPMAVCNELLHTYFTYLYLLNAYSEWPRSGLPLLAGHVLDSAF